MSNKERWLELIEQHKKSGEVAKYWCEKHKVSYINFITWRKRLSTNAPEPKKHLPAFIEIPEEKEDECLIEIECKGLVLRVTQGFDKALIKKYLTVMKGLAC